MKKAFEKSSCVILTAVIIALSISVFFTSYAETNTCTIQLSCSPVGHVYYGSDLLVVSTSGSLVADIGTEVTLTASPFEGYVFLYWINVENDRIVSFDVNYTFTVATYLKLQAVFYETSPGWHYITYLNTTNNIIRGMEQPINEAVEHIDYAPVKDGYTWTGNWTYTVEEIAISTDNLLVYPTFEKNAATYTVRTFLGIGGEMMTSETYEYCDKTTITAPDTFNGESFSYWAIIDEENLVNDIVSYYSTYEFYVTQSRDLTAVYGESVGDGNIIRMAGDNPDFVNNCVTVYTERSISLDYTVIQQGLLLTTNAIIARSEEDFVINESNPEIIKRTSNDTHNAGTYAVTKTKWSEQRMVGDQMFTVYPILYFRAYAVIKDGQGNTETIYSNFYVVNYYDEGGFMGDDVEDPFGN